MPKFKMTDMHKFKDGHLEVYKQSTTKNWYARFYTEGKYKVRSLGTTNFNTAKTIAQDWHDDLRYSQKHGKQIHGILFKDVVPDFLKYQQVLVKGGELSKDMAKDYKWRVNAEKGIFSYWKDIYIQDITLQTLNSYKEKRIISDGVKHTTITHEFGTLRQVLKYCALQNYIKGLPEFPKKSKYKPNPRPYFEKEEWQLLQKISKERIKNARGKRVRNSRECLHDFMMFMVHSGMRVDEVYRTTFGKVKIHKKKDKTSELHINIDGKTGIRKVHGMIGAVTAFERIRERNKGYKLTDLLFKENYREGLNNLLKETNLKMDIHGRTRNAKSFRSTFIMYRLMDRQPIKAVAQNCGTSSSVIDAYYARYITMDMFGDSFTDLPK
jgi:integrase